MSKFYLMMLRDKDCNGKTYTFAYNMVSEKLDPKLYAKLHEKVEFKTVEEAEANAQEIAKQLFIYDHTKRPKVLKDFRLYRWWILDAEKPIQVWCGCYHCGSRELDRGEFKTLAQLYPKDSCYGLKDAIAKKGKIDFSKEKDPSSGKFEKRKNEVIAHQKALDDAQWNDPASNLKYFVDESSACFGLDYAKKHALDLIPHKSTYIKNFHKDSLKIPSEMCFIFPTRGCKFGVHIASELGVDWTSRKVVWAVVVSRCKFRKLWKKSSEAPKEIYESEWKICNSLAEAQLQATLLGFKDPVVFSDPRKTNSLPLYVQTMTSYIASPGLGNGHIYTAVEVYRAMVADGVVQPIKKFMKKKVA